MPAIIDDEPGHAASLRFALLHKAALHQQQLASYHGCIAFEEFASCCR